MSANVTGTMPAAMGCQPDVSCAWMKATDVHHVAYRHDFPSSGSKAQVTAPAFPHSFPQPQVLPRFTDGNRVGRQRGSRLPDPRPVPWTNAHQWLRAAVLTLPRRRARQTAGDRRAETYASRAKAPPLRRTPEPLASLHGRRATLSKPEHLTLVPHLLPCSPAGHAPPRQRRQSERFLCLVLKGTEDALILGLCHLVTGVQQKNRCFLLMGRN